MPSYLPPRGLSYEQVLAPFLVAADLPFADVLTASHVARVFDDERVRFGNTDQTVFTPTVTLWAWLSQVVDEDKSCTQAVQKVASWRVQQHLSPCAEDTAAYCRARDQLPVAALRRLALTVGDNLEAAAPTTWLWCGRHVKLVDGTTVTCPDTPANVAAYPLSRGQKKGLCFPLIRLVVILSFATAAVLGLAAGPYVGKETGETALLRQLFDGLTAGDVLLADRYYCSYWMVALARARGVDVVFRMHQLRDYDFRRGEHLGLDDHVVVWYKPACPEWLDDDTYQSLPDVLIVRELRCEVTTPGCRTSELVIVTTLTDATLYTKAALADLYHQRWHAELDLRAIKVTLDIDHLRSQTPAMLEKELWVHCLGYNLVRKVSAQAAVLQAVSPRAVSFKASKQRVKASWSQLTYASAPEVTRQASVFLSQSARQLVGQRPDRCEPRAVKRAPKPHKRLRQPRAVARAKLLQPKRPGRRRRSPRP